MSSIPPTGLRPGTLALICELKEVIFKQTGNQDFIGAGGLHVSIPTYAWYGDLPLKLELPDEWDVVEHRMAGHDAPALTKDQIRSKLARPVGSKPLGEIAKDRKECVILVDDLTRPTKASQVIPQILDELHQAGMKNDHVRFVMATGAHHWMRLEDLRKKLGDDIPDRYHVYNHNVYENNTFLGNTSRGTPVHVNREVMSCDLKIAVGCIIPHMSLGFGGGGKIVLPGVASIETITHNHGDITEGAQVGSVERNARRLDAEEAAAMASLDFVVNVLVNPNRDTCDLVCGDFVAAHRAGVRLARSHYLTDVTKADVIIVNGYPMENEAYKVFDIIEQSLNNDGDALIIIHTPEGARGHYYNGRFGTNYGGKGWVPGGYLPASLRTKSFYVLAPHSSLADNQYFGLNSRWVKSWNEALRELWTKHSTTGVKVVVYPYAPMQIPEDNLES
jgi:nickel-dependent lactate racemase